MPYKLPTPCSAPGCSAVSHGRFCDKHRRQYWQEIDARQKPPAERGYNEKWRVARAAFLLSNPRCAECGTQATDVDHVVPHRGNELLFWAQENWQALCRRHHRGKTMRDDMPTTANLVYPLDLRPAAIPLTIVHGPSGSGKTTWVRQQVAASDIVIDLDEIQAGLAGLPMYWADEKWLRPGLARRNDILRSLADMTTGRAWFIVGAPRRAEQWFWSAMLKPERVMVLNVPLEQCIERLRGDERRGLQVGKHIKAAENWWKVWATP